MRFLASWQNTCISASGFVLGSAAKGLLQRGVLHFPFFSESLSLIPFSIGWKFRRAVYSRVLRHVGTSTVLHFGVTLDDPRTSIGEDVWISVGSYVDYAEIGDHVLIGPHAVLLAGGRHHQFDRLDLPIKSQENPAKAPLRIGQGAWIGANATVMAEVGHDAIVGAGSVVTHPVPPFAIVVGNPARVLRMRDTAGSPSLGSVDATSAPSSCPGER